MDNSSRLMTFCGSMPISTNIPPWGMDVDVNFMEKAVGGVACTHAALGRFRRMLTSLQALAEKSIPIKATIKGKEKGKSRDGDDNHEWVHPPIKRIKDGDGDEDDGKGWERRGSGEV
ncbi:hypothetical protein HAX54_005935 [Datura stramonium]|uniref:Uncharacterized protein n=1 Tax=Datura stramonium TaxID=4076 RepID=A0ABS8TB17_DATST|nr:hypothetical protein [Datura stramonium]